MSGANPANFSAGQQIANPIYIVDSSGNQISSFGGGTQYTDGGTPPTHPIGGAIEINNAGAWATVGSANPLPMQLIDSAGTNVAGVDSSHNALVKVNVALPAGTNTLGNTFLVDSAGTNLAGVDSSHNVLVKVNAAVPAGSNVIGSTTIQATSGTALQADQTNTILKTSLYVKTSAAADTVLALGQAAMAASVPVTMANNQTAMPVGVSAGTALDGNSGTISANSLRTVAGGAATGTKSNVASSASSVTILASNTSRKGATCYNDSTQICYLDTTGGTASSSSYGLQIPANGFFELPGPNIYNGAITGIWAAANGNMRVVEWT